MNRENPLNPEILLWAESLERHGLAEWAIPLLDVLQVWGFVAGQFLWMLTPFLGRQSSYTAIAEALEEPETLRRLQQCLIEGETQR